MISDLLQIIRSSRFQIFVLVVGGIIGVGLATQTPNPYLLTYPPIILITTVVFLLLRNIRKKNSSLSKNSKNKEVLIATAIIFAAIILGSNLFSLRTPVDFVLIYLMYAVCLVGLYLGTDRRLLLAITVVTGIVHRAMMYYSSEIVLGIDPLFHIRIANRVAAEGSLQPLATSFSKYYYEPLFHILHATANSLLGLSAAESSFWVLVVPYTVVTGTAAYLLSNQLGNQTAGVLAAILYVSSDASLGYSVSPQTTTLGILFFAVFLLIWSAKGRYNTKAAYSLLIFSFITISFTHQVSLFVTGVSFSLLWFGQILSNESQITSPATRELSGSQTVWQFFSRQAYLPIVLVWTLLAGKWLFELYAGPNGPEISVLSTVVLVFLRTFQSGIGAGGGGTTIPASIDASLPGSLSYSVVHVLGAAVLFGLTTYAILDSEYQDRQNKHRLFILAVLVTGLHGFLFVTLFAGFSNLFPLRWLAFLYLPMSVLASHGVLTLSKSIPARKQVRKGARILLILCVIVLMSGTHLGAIDNPLFDSADGAQRYAFTPQEASALEHAAEYQESGSVISDHLSATVINRKYQSNATTVNYDVERNRVQQDRNQSYLYRPYHETNHVWYDITTDSRTYKVIGEIPRTPINCTKSNVVYSNGGNIDDSPSLLTAPRVC